MKQIILLIFLLLAVNYACAAPVISNVVASSTQLWLGDPLNITATCTDNNTIDRVYTDIAGPGILLPGLDFAAAGNDSYLLTMQGSYFDRIGNYLATVFCAANNTKINTTTNFAISQLTGEISSMQSPVYVGSTIEIYFLPKKNSAVVTSDVSFSLYVDGEPVPFRIPPVYDTTKGWIFRADSPSVPRNYNIAISTTYQGKTIQTSSVVEIKGIVEFDITGLDRSLVIPDDNITVFIKAANRSSPIVLNESTLNIRVGSTYADISSIAQNGNTYNVRIKVPRLSAGDYQISAEMTYNGSTYVSSASIKYTTQLSGTITDATGKGINADIRFLRNGNEELRLYTRSDGTYSGMINPGTYDVEIQLPDATIYLEDAQVDSFADPIKYSYNPSARTEGLVISGIYSLAVGWNFGKASVTMKYDETLFDDESVLKVYKCESWNPSKSICNNPWKELTPAINPDKNTATITVSDFSVFAVGVEDRLKLLLTFDKTEYALKDLISIKGSTSSKQKQISDVSVYLKIEETNIEKTLKSDANGIFNLEFFGPESKGDYTITATAEKYPYNPYNTTYSLKILSIPSVSIVFPGSIQVMQGGNKTEDVRIINIGQTDITNIVLSLDLDEKYYKILPYLDRIGIKEEITIPVTFFAALDDNATTISAKLNFVSNEISKEKIFGFTILQNMQNTGNEITGKIAEKPLFDMNNINMNLIYVAIIAIVAFSSAFLMKKINKQKNAGKQLQVPEKLTHVLKQKSADKSDQQSINESKQQPIRETKNYQRPRSEKRSDSAAYLMEIKNYLNSRQQIEILNESGKRDVAGE